MPGSRGPTAGVSSARHSLLPPDGLLPPVALSSSAQRKDFTSLDLVKTAPAPQGKILEIVCYASKEDVAG